MRPRTSAARPLRRQTVLSAVLLIALTGCGAGPGTEAQIQTATTSTSLSPPAPSSPTMTSEAPVSLDKYPPHLSRLRLPGNSHHGRAEAEVSRNPV